MVAIHDLLNFSRTSTLFVQSSVVLVLYTHSSTLLTWEEEELCECTKWWPLVDDCLSFCLMIREDCPKMTVISGMLVLFAVNFRPHGRASSPLEPCPDRAGKRLRMCHWRSSRRGSWHENIDLSNTFRMKDPRVSWVCSKISGGVQIWNCGVQEICLITLTGRSFAKVWSLSGLPKSYLR